MSLQDIFEQADSEFRRAQQTLHQDLGAQLTAGLGANAKDSPDEIGRAVDQRLGVETAITVSLPLGNQTGAQIVFECHRCPLCLENSPIVPIAISDVVAVPVCTACVAATATRLGVVCGFNRARQGFRSCLASMDMFANLKAHLSIRERIDSMDRALCEAPGYRPMDVGHTLERFRRWLGKRLGSGRAKRDVGAHA